MKQDFKKIRRDEVPAEVLIKFKWRVIQTLMETYESQTMRLLANL